MEIQFSFMFIMPILFYLVFIKIVFKMLTVFEYIPNERNNLMLIIDNYAFNQYKSNDDGTISYRCKYYQTNGIKFKSSCTISKCQETGNDCMISTSIFQNL